MKKHSRFNRILSGILAFVLLLPPVPVRAESTQTETGAEVLPAASVAAEPRITRDGEAVRKLSLASHERIEILAEHSEADASYQWQILHPEKPDVWINISDATHSDLFVTLALVRNMMKEDQTAQLRCRVTAGGQMWCTDPVTVQYCPDMPYALPGAVEEPSETAPVETVEATLSVETEEPTVPAETVEATLPVETEEPTVPAETVAETTPAETVEATLPVETEEPTVPAETVPETIPAETVEETLPVETEEPTVPAETVAETTPAEIEEETLPVETEEPTVPAELVAETVPETLPAPTAFVEEVASSVAADVPVNPEASEFVSVIIDYVRFDFARNEKGELIPNTGDGSYHGYQLEDEGTVAFTSYKATLQYGTDLETTVSVPTLVGYTPYLENGTSAITEVAINATNITKDIRITVKYKPAQVKYTVRYYFQNIYDDLYVEDMTMKIEGNGFTGAMPPENHMKLSPDDVDTAYPYMNETEREALKEKLRGFTSLFYQPDSIAADGSTVFEVYYERNYYLMEFYCNGGYGTDTLYSRYGSYINVPSPVLAGYVFGGWDFVTGKDEEGKPIGDGKKDDLPENMPAKNTAYVAIWNTAETTYTVAYWIEHADGTKSYLGSCQKSASSGKHVSGGDDLTATTLLCDYPDHVHTEDCYSCDHIHTEDCVSGWNGAGRDPKGDELIALQALGAGEPEAGFIYLIDAPTYDYIRVKLGDTWYGWDYYGSERLLGNELHRVTLNGYTVSKHRIKESLGDNCGHDHYNDPLVCSEHTHSSNCYVDNFIHLNYVDADVNVPVEGDGSTVVNVYYEYKTYRLKFYYAAANGDTRSSENVAYRIVGGCSYYFGGQHDGVGVYSDYLNSSTFDMLNRMFKQNIGYVGNVASGQVPSLKESVADKNIYDIGCDYDETWDRTYYYISFTARFNDTIADKWPADVFNPVEMKSDSTTSSGLWTGKRLATVSAWNGEHHVWYSRRIPNETIKGKYEKLDSKIVYDSELYTTYPESTDSAGKYPLPTISYLCFWENGAQANWNVPELYRYNIYLEALPNTPEKDTDIIKQRKNAQGETEYIRYCLYETYDTCDDSDVNTQTQTSRIGFNAVIYGEDSTVEKNAAGEYVLVADSQYHYDKTYEYRVLEKDKDYSGDQYYLGRAVNFYYDRIHYKLNFVNHGANLTHGSGSDVPYGMNLSLHGEYVSADKMNNAGIIDPTTQKPFDPYPTTLEPNAYVFTGWYTTENFTPGTEMNWNSTMPASDMVVYARWEPVKHNVTFYTLYEDIGKQEGEEGYHAPFLMAPDVLHGSILGTSYNQNPSEVENPDPRISGYTFIGWFYMDEDNKKRFAPDSMEIDRDLVLFAEWKTSIDTTYEIQYVLGNEYSKDGETYPAGHPIADGIFAHASVGMTKTFAAKGNTDLYLPFRKNLYPMVNSHSILMKEEDAENTFTFEYLYDDQVFYKVRYLEASTNKPLDEAYEYSTSDSVITVKFKPIPGYLPQNYYIRKTLAYDDKATSAIEENIITFYYVKDKTHGMYSVEYYLENADSTDSNDTNNYTQYESIVGTTDLIVNGKPNIYTAEKRSYEGYTHVPSMNTVITYKDNGKVDKTLTGIKDAGDPPRGTVSANGLTIKLYYKRQLYPYTVEYWVAGSNIDAGKTFENGFLTVAEGNNKIVPHKGTGYFDTEQSWSLIRKDDNGELIRDHSTIEVEGNTYEFYPNDPANAEKEKTKTITIRADEDENRIIFYFIQKRVAVFYHAVCTDPALKDICGAVSLASEDADTLSGSRAIPKTGFAFKGWYQDEACEKKVSDDWLKQTDPNHLIPGDRDQNTDDQDPNNDWVNHYYALFEPVLEDITITKTGENLGDDTFLFQVTGTNVLGRDVDFMVSIHGAGSVTIQDLYCGSYTVKELTNWSWTYECTNAAEQTVTLLADDKDTDGNPIMTYGVTFNNKAKTVDWLHGEGYVDNEFK